MIEFAGTNVSVTAQQGRLFEMLDGNFAKVLTAPKERCELADGFDMQAHARVLVSASIGLDVANRAAGTLMQGNFIGHSIANMIRSWAV